MGAMPAVDDTPLGRRRAGRAGDVLVVWRTEDGSPGALRLDPGRTRASIGRGPSNDIALGWDTEVARVHAELERLGGEWTIVDEGSSRTGTWRNGERLTGRQRLRHGDVVQVGQTSLAIHIPTVKAPRKRGGVAPATGAAALTAAQRRVLVALCLPYRESEFAAPASDEQIAEELFLSVDAVRAHLRGLATLFGVAELPPAQRRAAIARRALQLDDLA
jgi:predicted component of type VI protein secretion system